MSVLADEACSHFGASLDRKAATDSELSFSDVYPPSWLTRVESTDHPLDRPPLSRPAAVAESAGSAIAKGDMNGFRNSLKQALEYARGNNELFDEFKSTLAEAVKKNGYTVKLNDRVNPIENDTRAYPNIYKRIAGDRPDVVAISNEKAHKRPGVAVIESERDLHNTLARLQRTNNFPVIT